MSKIIIDICSEGDAHPYKEALVHFYEYEDSKREIKWIMRGVFDGYASKNGMLVGYINLPVDGFDTSIHEGSSMLGEIPTQYPAQDRRRMRVIWNVLQYKGFVLEEIEEPTTEEEACSEE